MNKLLKCLSITATSAIIAQSLSALPLTHVYAEADTTADTSATLTADESLYKEVLDDYVNNVIPTGTSSAHPEWLSGGWCNTSGDLSAFVYTFYDLNADGVNELFIGKADESENVALEAFTVYEDSIIRLNNEECFCVSDTNENTMVMYPIGAPMYTLYNLIDGELVSFKRYECISDEWFVVEGESEEMTPVSEEEVNADVVAVQLFGKSGLPTFADYSEKSSEVTPSMTEEELKATVEGLGTISSWAYHDYDGNGTSEAFALITDADENIYLYFISADGEVSVVMDKTELSFYEETDKYYEINKHGFFTFDFGSEESGSSTALFSVKDNAWYKLAVSDELHGFYQREDGAFCTTVPEVYEDGSVEYAEYFLVYDEENYEFSIGARVPEPDTRNHQCGDNAYWAFDEETGVLTVSGKGSIYDYNDAHPFFSFDPETDPPYAEFAESIKQIVIEEGITNIGNKAFYGSYVSLEDIVLPEGLKTIGDDAFNIMFFGEVPTRGYELPEQVILIGDRAFYAMTDVEIESEGIFIPRSVKYIGENAFGYYGYIQSVDDEEKVVKMDGFKIQGYKDSEAQKYAENNGFEFEEWVDLDDDGNVIVYETKSNSGGSTSSSSSGSSVVQSSPKTGVAVPVGATVAGVVALAGLAITARKKENK